MISYNDQLCLFYTHEKLHIFCQVACDNNHYIFKSHSPLICCLVKDNTPAQGYGLVTVLEWNYCITCTH